MSQLSDISFKMAMIGWQEWLLILLVIVIIFGVGRIPQVGEAMGKGIRNFKKALSGEDEKKSDDEKKDSDKPESK
ncbi:MAG: hypothetical protein Kow0090_22490 [Myxococcota bacterium]